MSRNDATSLATSRDTSGCAASSPRPVEPGSFAHGRSASKGRAGGERLKIRRSVVEGRPFTARCTGYGHTWVGCFRLRGELVSAIARHMLREHS